MSSAFHTQPAKAAEPLWPPRAAGWLALGWSLVVGLALWWLLRANAAAPVVVIRQVDSPESAITQTFHGWIGSDAGLQRLYPWLLFGPYAALVAFYLPLERGRLRLNLPLNLAVCAAFLAASHALNSCNRLKLVKVTFIQARVGGHGAMGARPSGREFRDLLAATNTSRVIRETAGAFAGGAAGPWGAEWTNLAAQLPTGFRPPGFPPELPGWSLWSTLLDLVAYGAILGLAHSVHFYRRFRERETRALLLESSLAQARLGALQAQLRPHFLFNSLNAIATLLRRDPRLAESTLMSLSELLRLALSQSERQEVTLREEMRLVQRYLEIQQTRFGEKLRVEQEIEPAALDCLVPTLLLQPLVENAIRHGLEPAENAGLVRLTGQRREGKLALMVEDDGVGLAGPPEEGHAPPMAGRPADLASLAASVKTAGAVSNAGRGAGIGLANLRARLETLYGANQTLELTARSEGGVAVRIQIPWHTA